MATIHDLRDSFEKFCAFGRGSNPSLTDITSSGSTMDGAKWAKFARDCNLLDNKKISSTEIDIIFNKVKGKSARRISWDEFQEACKLVAAKKYPGMHPQDAFIKIIYDVCVLSHGPTVRATSVKKDAVLDRLTDVNGYTGTHKNRFDSAGKGLGLAGRETSTKTDTLHKIVNRDAPELPAKSARASLAPAGRVSVGPASPRGKRVSVLTQSEERLEDSSSRPPLAGGTRQARQLHPREREQQQLDADTVEEHWKSSQDVFDRLTDTSGYTGTHQHRFNKDGTGRGLAGREGAPMGAGTVGQYRGGNVTSLSQILRN
ncbi:p25-alpha-domain-containing protein [Chytriomyces sp. MP71]|nr:p25-alpha-domain-containing protein [Chytriomyces sp. MP71]